MCDQWGVILNPRTAADIQTDLLDEVLKVFQPYRLIPTDSPEQASRVSRNLVREGYRKILVLGGDGSFNVVLNALAPDFDQVELAILPLGTGNDLARAMGTPQDPREAAVWVAEGAAVRIDVVRLQSAACTRYFVNSSVGGFGTKVDDHLDQKSKNLFGSLAFYLSTAKALPELRSYELDLEIQDAAAAYRLKSEAYAVVLANGRSVAGGIPVSPEGLLDDGLAELLVIPLMPPATLVISLAQLLAGTHLKSENLILRKVKKVKVNASPPFEVNADGEVIASTPVQYEVLPRALTIRVGTGPRENPAMTSP